MKFLVLFGRILFSLIFLNTIFGHFSSQGIGYAEASGVPIPSILVPLSGVIAILGGLSILLGYKAKAGAWLITIFLIPITIFMHDFWMLEGAEAQAQMVHFMKNLSMLGGAFIIAYFGAGPLSIDNRKAFVTDTAEATRRQRFQPEFSREEARTSERIKPQRKEKERADR